MRLKYGFLMAVMAILACACQRHAKSEPVHIARLDQAMQEYALADADRRQAIVDSMHQEIFAFFALMDIAQPDAEALEDWSQGREVAVFQPDVNLAYPNLQNLEEILGQVYANAADQAFPVDSLRFAAVAYGKPMPVVRIGDVMIIALNHYLGADYPGYSHWDAYRRADKDAALLPYDLVAAMVATSHPMDMGREVPTLLSNMLYEGALMQARMSLIPDAELHRALGVTPEQLQFMQENLPEIWREMVEKKLIYDTNPLTSDQLLAGAPFSPLLNGQTPARVGRYVGYCIVQAYLNSHPQATLSDLFQPDFYGKSSTLADSKFNAK